MKPTRRSVRELHRKSGDGDYTVSHVCFARMEPAVERVDLARLGPEERALYDDLRWLRLSERPLRLEQERIGFGLVAQAVAEVSLQVGACTL